MSYKTCPDWPELMELAPDLQFKHITVADAQLPFDVLSRSRTSRSARSRSAATSTITSSTRPTPIRGRGGARGTHWFEVHEWATSGPGASSHAA